MKSSTSKSTRVLLLFLFAIIIIGVSLQLATTAKAGTYSNGGVTVYITKTGSKYHRSGCQYLRSSKIAVTLIDAVSSGYTPCSRCSPPTYYVTTYDDHEPTTPSTTQQPTEHETKRTYTAADILPPIPTFETKPIESFEIPTHPKDYEYPTLSTKDFETIVNESAYAYSNQKSSTTLLIIVCIASAFAIYGLCIYLYQKHHWNKR